MMENNVKYCGQPFSTDKDEYQHFSCTYCQGQMIVNGVTNGETTVFNGIASNNSFYQIGDEFGAVLNLLKRAINNRTTERDYFKLYSEMLEGIISEDEFEDELVKNEEKYVIVGDVKPTKNDLMLALRISAGIKDLNSSEDISSLYSFDSIEVDKLLIGR